MPSDYFNNCCRCHCDFRSYYDQLYCDNCIESRGLTKSERQANNDRYAQYEMQIDFGWRGTR